MECVEIQYKFTHIGHVEKCTRNKSGVPLKPISEIPEIDKSLLRLKVSYKGNKRTIAQAIVSLLTNGQGVKGSVDGITFANFLQDCNWTEEMAKEKILKFPTADPSNVA
jgi:hypothetical protein